MGQKGEKTIFLQQKSQKGSQPKKAIPFHIQSDWEPAPSQIPESLEEELQKIIMSVRKIDPAPPTEKNLTKAQYKALRHLERIKQKVIICKADKGSVVVLQNRSDYVMEAEGQLLDTNFYQKINTPIFEETVEMFMKLLLDLLEIPGEIGKEGCPTVSGISEKQIRTPCPKYGGTKRMLLLSPTKDP